MKKLFNLKTLASAILMILASNGAFAQINNPQVTAVRPDYAAIYSNPANYSSIGSDKATVNAEMPYFVLRDATVNGLLFNPSTFGWSWSAGITGLRDFTSPPVTPITKFVAATPLLNLFSYNQVVATIGTTIGTGAATITVQEKSNPKVGTGCLDITGKTLTIDVFAPPTFSIPSTTLGGCGLNSAGVKYQIASTLTGVAPFYIDYTISAVDVNNVAIGTTKTYNATIALATDKIDIDPTQLADVAGVATAPNGIYTVTITKVWDAISLRAINSSVVAVSTPVTAGLNKTDIAVYPSPTTNSIQFIKTLP